MTFTVTLASDPQVRNVPASIFLESPHFTRRIDFGAPGSVISMPFDLPLRSAFDLVALFEVANASAMAAFRGLGTEDHLAIMALRNGTFFATAIHNTAVQTACKVRCSTGPEKEGCIVCKAGTLTIKICC